MKCPIPECDGELIIEKQIIIRSSSGNPDVEYTDGITTKRRCNKCGFEPQFYEFKSAKMHKEEWKEK